REHPCLHVGVTLGVAAHEIRAERPRAAEGLRQSLGRVRKGDRPHFLKIGARGQSPISIFANALRELDPVTKPRSLFPQSLISRSSDIMGGTPVFAGTRVPIQTLLDYLEAGETIDAFLEGFPTVTREQVIAFLEEAKARM